MAAVKTTFIKILCGLYEPSSGNIFINNQEISKLEKNQYRQLFSVVFSDFHLFNEATPILRAHDDTLCRLSSLFQLDQSTRTKIANGKINELSQGQKKRLALLLATSERRAIYIFDEPGLDLDPNFRFHLYTKLIPSLKQNGSAVLVITHDETYFHMCDRLLHMNDGVITEDLAEMVES